MLYFLSRMFEKHPLQNIQKRFTKPISLNIFDIFAELNEALPSDFWSEDIFNEPVSKCANNSKELDNNKVLHIRLLCYIIC